VEKRLRVIIADDHSLFRQGLKLLLSTQDEIEVVGETDRFSQVASLLTTIPCDLLLLDLQMERWVIGDIPRLSRVTRIIVLTASERKEDAIASLQSGARAVVHKAFALENLMEAIRAVAKGLVWISSELRDDLGSLIKPRAAIELSNREIEIIGYVASGLHNGEVAKRLSIGESTVKTHLNNIFQKLRIRDRVTLALYAQRMGILEPPRGRG
jgi:two-component system NarL family response regulator